MSILFGAISKPLPAIYKYIADGIAPQFMDFPNKWRRLWGSKQGERYFGVFRLHIKAYNYPKRPFVFYKLWKMPENLKFSSSAKNETTFAVLRATLFYAGRGEVRKRNIIFPSNSSSHMFCLGGVWVIFPSRCMYCIQYTTKKKRRNASAVFITLRLLCICCAAIRCYQLFRSSISFLCSNSRSRCACAAGSDI